MSEMRGLIAIVIASSNRNRRFDGGMGVVIFEGEVFKLECEQVRDGRVQMHCGHCARLARQLLFGLIQMVQIQVGVAERMDEITWLEAADLRDHQRQ